MGTVDHLHDRRRSGGRLARQLRAAAEAKLIAIFVLSSALGTDNHKLLSIKEERAISASLLVLGDSADRGELVGLASPSRGLSVVMRGFLRVKAGEHKAVLAPAGFKHKPKPLRQERAIG